MIEGELVDVTTETINAELVRAGVAVSEIVCQRPSLAAFFERLTREGG